MLYYETLQMMVNKKVMAGVLRNKIPRKNETLMAALLIAEAIENNTDEIRMLRKLLEKNKTNHGKRRRNPVGASAKARQGN